MMIRYPPPELAPYCHVCAGLRNEQDWDTIKHRHPPAEPHRTHRKTPHGSVVRRKMREPRQDGYKRYTVFGIDQLQDSPRKWRNIYSSASISPPTPPYYPQHVLPEAFTPEESSYNRAKRKPFFKAFRLVEDFLIPRLNSGHYGDLLKWEDKERGVIKISWTQPAKSSWSKKEQRVFLDWDRIKNRKPPDLVNSKKRLLNFCFELTRYLRNIKTVREEPSQDGNGYKRYKIFGIDQLQNAILTNGRNTHSSAYVSPPIPPDSDKDAPPQAATPEESSKNRARRKPTFKREMYSSDVDEEEKDDPVHDPTYDPNCNPQSSCGRRNGRKRRNISVKKEATSVAEGSQDTKPLKKLPREFLQFIKDQPDAILSTKYWLRSKVSQTSSADSIIKQEEEIKVKEESVPAFRPIPLDSAPSIPKRRRRSPNDRKCIYYWMAQLHWNLFD